MKKVRLEVWKCDNNEEEIHLFDGTQYIFGYNPEKIDGEWVEQQLAKWNYELPKE